jgi:23S rRNA (guanosine2251-2'-O)-methyltransferase
VARAEEYGATLYQRPRRAPGGRRRVAVGVAAAVAVLLLAGRAGPASAAEAKPTDFRISRVEHVRGVSHLTVVAPRVLGPDAPAAAEIQVLDVADGSPLDAQVNRLPAAPLEVVLVADVSGGPASIEAIQGALREFVLSLPEGSAVTVVAAGDEPHLVAALTRSPDTALAGIALLAPGEPGLPEAAIDLGLDQLTGTPGTRPVVVEIRTGSQRSATAATTALDATRDRLTEGRIDVYAVELGTSLRRGPLLPVPTGGGLVLEARFTRHLMGAVDSIAADLSLPRYQVDIFGLQFPRGVRLVSDWRSVHSEGVEFAGPPLAEERPPPPAPEGPPLKALAAAAAVVVVAAVLLVPPWRRRRRAAREAAAAPRPVGLRLDPAPGTAPPAPWTTSEAGVGGEDVEGIAAVRALLAERSRRVAEVWLADDLEPAVRVELEELAAGRRIPVRAGRRPGAALPVAARAAPISPADLGALWSRGRRPVVLAVAGAPSPADLGSMLRAAGWRNDDGGTVVTGVVLPRQPSSRVTAATAAAAAGAIEWLPLALVPDLGVALSAARAVGVRVVGVTESGAPDTEPLVPDGPTIVVVSATGGLERSLRARCDAVVALEGAGAADRVERLVAAIRARAEPEVDTLHAPSSG